MSSRDKGSATLRRCTALPPTIRLDAVFYSGTWEETGTFHEGLCTRTSTPLPVQIIRRTSRLTPLNLLHGDRRKSVISHASSGLSASSTRVASDFTGGRDHIFTTKTNIEPSMRSVNINTLLLVADCNRGAGVWPALAPFEAHCLWLLLARDEGRTGVAWA